MNTDDMQLRLLAKLPLYVDSIPIYSPELIDIASLGVEEYQKVLANCTINRNSINIGADLEDMDNFDILVLFILKQQDFLESFLKGLKFFTRKNFMIDEQDNDLFFFYEEKVEEKIARRMLTRNNYDDFINVIKFANCIEAKKPEKELDDFDRRILEAEKKLKELENQNSEAIPFKDLVSSVANMNDNNLNILNIWQINMFTFYDQMKRGQLKEAYIIGLKQLLAGAKPEDVNLEYYIKKIN